MLVVLRGASDDHLLRLLYLHFPTIPYSSVGLSCMDSITSRGIYIERESAYYSFATLSFELARYAFVSFASSQGRACRPNIQESPFKLHRGGFTALISSLGARTASGSGRPQLVRGSRRPMCRQRNVQLKAILNYAEIAEENRTILARDRAPFLGHRQRAL